MSPSPHQNVLNSSLLSKLEGDLLGLRVTKGSCQCHRQLAGNYYTFICQPSREVTVLVARQDPSPILWEPWLTASLYDNSKGATQKCFPRRHGRPRGKPPSLLLAYFSAKIFLDEIKPGNREQGAETDGGSWQREDNVHTNG